VKNNPGASVSRDVLCIPVTKSTYCFFKRTFTKLHLTSQQTLALCLPLDFNLLTPNIPHAANFPESRGDMNLTPVTEHPGYGNLTSPTQTCRDAKCIIFAVANVIIFILGVAGNGLVIWIAGFKMKKSVITTWYLSLAVSDFIFCCSLPFGIIHKVKNEWLFGSFLCEFRYFIKFFNMYTSILILVIISVDRCVIVMFPVWAQNQRTLRKAYVVVVLVWIISAVLSTPMAIFRDVQQEQTKHCVRNYGNGENLISTVASRFVFGFVIPFHIIILCYIIIMRRLKSSKTTNSKKPFKIMTMVIGAFLICWLPYHTFSFLQIMYEKSNSFVNFGKLFGITLANANSFINPFLYAFMVRSFKEQCNALLSKIENALEEEAQYTFQGTAIATNASVYGGTVVSAKMNESRDTMASNSTSEREHTGSEDHSNLTSPYCTEAICIFYVVTNAVIFMLGVVGNVLVIWIAGFRMKKTVISTWYLCLAISDFMFCSILPFNVIYMVKTEWTFGVFMCKFMFFSLYFNWFSSIFLLVVISVDRYVVVMFPVWAQNHRTIRNASLTVTLTWIVSAAYCIPSALFFNVSVDNHQLTKLFFYHYESPLQHTVDVVCDFIFGFLIPCLIITACYVVIIRKLKSTQMARSRKPFKIMTVLIASFFICCLPYHTFALMELNYQKYKTFLNTASTVALALANASSCLNPFLYAFMGKDFKNQCSALLTKIENAIDEEEDKYSPRGTAANITEDQLAELSRDDIRDLLPGPEHFFRRKAMWLVAHQDECCHSFDCSTSRSKDTEPSTPCSTGPSTSITSKPNPSKVMKMPSLEYVVYTDSELDQARKHYFEKQLAGKEQECSLSKELRCRLIRNTVTNMISVLRATVEDFAYPSKHDIIAMAKRLVEYYPMLRDRSVLCKYEWVMDELQRILQPSNHKYIGELKERWKVFCSKLQFYGVMKKIMRPPMTLDEVQQSIEILKGLPALFPSGVPPPKKLGQPSEALFHILMPSENAAAFLGRHPLSSPLLLIDQENCMITIGKNPVTTFPKDLLHEGILYVMAYYYALHLTYPKCIATLLSVLQTEVLGDVLHEQDSTASYKRALSEWKRAIDPCETLDTKDIVVSRSTVFVCFTESRGIMNSTPETETEHFCKQAMNMFYTVANVIIFILGVTGNGLVIWIAGFRMKKSVVTTWYLSLAVSDFLFCSFLPFNIVYVINDFWNLGPIMLKFIVFNMFFNWFNSIFLLLIISVDRCVVVMFPVWAQNHRTIKKATVIVMLAWIISALFCLPSAFSLDVVHNNTEMIKFMFYNYTDITEHIADVTSDFIVGFMIPFFIIVICYLIIIQKLRSNQMTKSKKPFKIMTVVIAAFFICWLPYHTFAFMELNYKKYKSFFCSGYIIALTLANASSCLNPFLYAFMGRNVKKQCYAPLMKIENAIDEEDGECMWNGLSAITDYKGGGICDMGLSSSLADELNAHYAHFEADKTSPSTKLPVDQESCAPSTSVSEVVRSFKAVNPHKAPGPDGIYSRRLRACAIQLAEVFTDIFNLSLRLSVIPTCFKRTTIFLVPKTPAITCLNDYCPVALTSTAMQCFERLIKTHICSSLPATMDPHQFAKRSNRSTDDAIALTVHSAFTHLDRKNTCENAVHRLQLSSAFETIIPAKLIPKLTDLGLKSHLHNWVLDFLTGRPQVVRVGNSFSSTLTLSTGAPQGCVLSPLLYSLFTHDCVARQTTNVIFKFADSTILGHITDGDETVYRKEVSTLSEWCYHNNLSLNISKTKEMMVDYRKLQRGGHSPLYINGAEVEMVSSVKFLGVHLTYDLTWSLHTNKVLRSARERLFFLRRLRKFGLPPDILTNFYRCTIESILTACITVWYGNCTAYDHKTLKRVVRTAESIIGSKLPDLQDFYRSRCLRKIQKIWLDSRLIIFILGVAGNGLVIWIAGFKVKKSVITTWYLSLAVSDFIYCSTLPLFVVYVLSRNWPFGLFMCKFNSFIMWLNMFSSIFLLTIISVDRCVVVMFPVWAQNQRS
ncbi:hypothetical protein NFI96_033825, partial [Prochilodus magdalenae]